MDPYNFWRNHDEDLGHPAEKWYEFKPTLRDTLHVLIDQHMTGRKKCLDNKDPPYNGLQYIPHNKKEKLIKDMEEKTNHSLLVYEIKLPSTQATSAQEFLMRNMIDLKDGTRDNPPPGIPRAFINFEMLNLPETTPLDDLRKCQFAIELKKELCSPISTLIRIPTRAQKKQSQNIKLLENLLECSTSIYSVQTISQVKFMSDDDKLKLYATYLGSCNNCIADGSVCGIKTAFDDSDVIGDNDLYESGDDGDSVTGSTGRGKTTEVVSMDTDDDDATSCNEEDTSSGALVVDEDVTVANGSVQIGDISSNDGGKDIDLSQVFFAAGENKQANSLPSSSSTMNAASADLRNGEVNHDDNTAKPGCGDCATTVAGVEPIDKDSAKPTKRQVYRAKRNPKIMINSCTFSEKPPLSYRNKLEFARIMAVDVHSDGTNHTHYAYYDKNKEQIYDTIREKSKKTKNRKPLKRKRKVVKNEGEDAWKKIKIVNINNDTENNTQSCD